jgi:hypothetical protein
MHFGLDHLLDLGLPGLVFLGLSIWLIRKAIKAARTERDLEEERLEGTLADELRAGRARAGASQRSTLMAVAPPGGPPADPLAGADRRGAHPAHLLLIAELLRVQHAETTEVADRVEVLWVRSNESHVVWCERRHAGIPAERAPSRDVICVAQVEGGAVAGRWSFG